MTVEELEALGYSFNDKWIYVNNTKSEIYPYSYFKRYYNHDATNSHVTYYSVDGVEYEKAGEYDSITAHRYHQLQDLKDTLVRSVKVKRQEIKRDEKLIEKITQYIYDSRRIRS